jgi:hypothetical protein
MQLTISHSTTSKDNTATSDSGTLSPLGTLPLSHGGSYSLPTALRLWQWPLATSLLEALLIPSRGVICGRAETANSTTRIYIYEYIRLCDKNVNILLRDEKIKAEKTACHWKMEISGGKWMYCIRDSAVVGTVMPTLRQVNVLHQSQGCCRYSDANCKALNVLH